MARSKPKPKLSVAFLYDDTLDSNDGVSQYVKTLGAWLNARGHKVSYLVGETKLKKYAGGNVYSLARNLKVVFNGNHLSIPYAAKKRNIQAALSASAPDIIHVQVPYSPLMAQKVISRAGKIPVVGSFHIFPAGTLVKLSARLLRLIYLGSLGRFVSIRSVSQPAQNFARKSFHIDSGILPNMVDLGAYQSRKTQTDKNMIVFVGRLVERKGCAYLIKAFARLAAENPDLRLVIAGKGEQQQSLQKLVGRLGLADQVTFKGYVSEDEKMSLLGSAAVACYPSLYGESFGIVLIEAMAAGSAVVLAGDNPGYVAVMENNHDVLVDPKDIDEFSHKLKTLVYDAPLRAKLLSWQAKLVRKYDVNTVGPKVEQWYLETIAKNR